MGSIDLRDAFQSIPVHSDFRQLLRFFWKGKLYEFQCLPFGLSSAPRTFTKVMRPVMALLRRKAVRCLIFMDDPVLLSSTKQELFQILQKTMTLLSLLGFQNQQGKIRLDSNTEDPVFGLYGGLQNNDAEFAGGENQEINSGLQAGSEAVLIVNSDNRKIDREGCQQPHKQSFQPLCTIGPSRDSRMQPPGGQMSQQDKERGCYNSANCTFVDSTDLVTISVGGTDRLSNPSASEQR